MRKNILTLFASVSLFGTAFSADFYWGNNTGTDWGNWGVNWTDSNGNGKSYPPGASDNAIFDVSVMKYVSAATMTRDETVNNLIFQNAYRESDGVKTPHEFSIYVRNGKGSHTLNIGGNLIKLRGESDSHSSITSGSATDRISVNITGTDGVEDSGYIVVGSPTDTSSSKGDLHLGGHSLATSLDKLTVAKGVNLYMGSTLCLNVGNNTGTIENPDVVINGVVSLNGSGSSNPHFTLLSCSDGSGLNSVIQIGGLKGNGSTRIDELAKGSATLVFVNEAGTSYEYNGYLRSYSDAKIKLVMNGEGTQILRPTWNYDLEFYAEGGIDILKGTLKLFNYKSVGNILIDGGSLQAIGATAKLSTETSSSWKRAEIHADNLTWRSGKIITDVDTKGFAGKIILSGKLEIAEDAAGPIEFEFTGDLRHMLEDWIEIMSFEEGAEGLTAEDFTANNYGDYAAKFKIENNSLYAMYTAVPEPAAFASVFGSLVIAFVIYRRRK